MIYRIGLDDEINMNNINNPRTRVISLFRKNNNILKNDATTDEGLEFK